MAVLLIGSTGMGKSAFGNFLINPDEDHIFQDKKRTFAVATDNTPMTQEVQIAHKEVLIDFTDDVVPGTCIYLTVIDTPGLNESAEKDLSHMIQIIKKLNEVGKIQACILVVKFNAKIDAQYKATMEYYSKLLPGLFDKNVIIVMTDFARDDRSERFRSKLKIDVDQVKENTISELCKCSNTQLSYSPLIFMLDCLPMDEKEFETSKKIRNTILQYIFQLEPVKFTDQKVAKTSYLKELDNGRIRELEGQIQGYNTRLQESHQESKDALNETQQKEIEVAKTEAQLMDLQRKHDDFNKDDKVIAQQHSIEKGWKLFCWLTHDVCIDTDCDIIDYNTWTNGKCKFIMFDETSSKRSLRGKVEGEFMRGIYASITANTEKRQKYAKNIMELKAEIEVVTKKREEYEEARVKMQERYQEHIKQIEILQKYIAEKGKEIQDRSMNYLTVDEALARLDELKA